MADSKALINFVVKLILKQTGGLADGVMLANAITKELCAKQDSTSLMANDYGVAAALELRDLKHLINFLIDVLKILVALVTLVDLVVLTGVFIKVKRCDDVKLDVKPTPQISSLISVEMSISVVLDSISEHRLVIVITTAFFFSPIFVSDDDLSVMRVVKTCYIIADFTSITTISQNLGVCFSAGVVGSGFHALPFQKIRKSEESHTFN